MVIDLLPGPLQVGGHVLEVGQSEDKARLEESRALKDLRQLVAGEVLEVRHGQEDADDFGGRDEWTVAEL